jgi:hypothetical protein
LDTHLVILYEDMFPLKGNGTRDYNLVPVVWSDKPWLGERPADIHIFFNNAFNLILLAPTAFEFAKNFSNPVRLPLAGFKKWCCAVRF